MIMAEYFTISLNRHCDCQLPLEAIDIWTLYTSEKELNDLYKSGPEIIPDKQTNKSICGPALASPPSDSTSLN